MKVTQESSSAIQDSKYMVPVVRSTFKILAEMSRSGSMNLNEVSQKTGVAKSTVFRILSTLNVLGYIVRDTHMRTYHLSPRLAELFTGASATDGLRRAALPYMLKLREQFGETVNLGQLNLDKVIYVEVVPSEYALRLSERPGASVPAHASALGKAILAYSPPEVVRSLVESRELPALTPNTITDREALLRELQRVRARGYAFDKEEASLLANCVGAPILDSRGMAIAALSISGPTSRFFPRRDKPVTEGLCNAVAQISEQFRHAGSELGPSNLRHASVTKRG